MAPPNVTISQGRGPADRSAVALVPTFSQGSESDSLVDSSSLPTLFADNNNSSGAKKISKQASDAPSVVVVDVVPTERLRMATLTVGGLTCASCVANIESTLSARDGIAEVTVSLMTEKAAVKYDPFVLKAAQVAEMVEDMGYEASALEDEPVTIQSAGAQQGVSSTVSLTVIGMTCASCAANIENALMKVCFRLHYTCYYASCAGRA